MAIPNSSPLPQKTSIEVVESTADTTEAIALAIPCENAPEAGELPKEVGTPQIITAKPAYEMVAVPDEKWQVGDHIVVDATDLPPSLRGFDGRRGIVDQVKELPQQCLVDFGGDDFMHIPYRGLKRR
jgi:hypothetical protein